LELSLICRIFAEKSANQEKQTTMKESKPYPIFDEEDGSCMTAQEPTAGAEYAFEEPVIPDHVAYAHIENGVLQVTPDIEDEIAEVERGETVSMAEFKTMFAQWL